MWMTRLIYNGDPLPVNCLIEPCLSPVKDDTVLSSLSGPLLCQHSAQNSAKTFIQFQAKNLNSSQIV